MAGSFNGVSFRDLAHSAPRQQNSLTQEADYTITQIPGGNTSYLDVAGQKPAEIQGWLTFASDAALDQMRAQLGQTGTLVYWGQTYSNALLVLCRRRERWPGGIAGSSGPTVVAECQWILSQ